MNFDFELWFSIIGAAFFAAVGLTACDLDIENWRLKSGKNANVKNSARRFAPKSSKNSSRKARPDMTKQEWMRFYHVYVTPIPGAALRVETEHPDAWVSKLSGKPGETGDEALRKLAKSNGWPLWDEEGGKENEPNHNNRLT